VELPRDVALAIAVRAAERAAGVQAVAVHPVAGAEDIHLIRPTGRIDIDLQRAKFDPRNPPPWHGVGTTLWKAKGRDANGTAPPRPGRRAATAPP